MLTKFNGYKTYVLAGAAIVYAISGFVTGHIDGKTALDIVWAALTAGSLRHAVTKSQ